MRGRRRARGTRSKRRQGGARRRPSLELVSYDMGQCALASCSLASAMRSGRLLLEVRVCL